MGSNGGGVPCADYDMIRPALPRVRLSAIIVHMATVVRINGRVDWQCFRANGGNWVAVCEPLKLTLQAETWGNLMEDIALTLDALLKDLLSSNELDRFLRERGWAIVGSIPNRRQHVRFDLPFFAAMMGAHGSQTNLHQ